MLYGEDKAYNLFINEECSICKLPLKFTSKIFVSWHTDDYICIDCTIKHNLIIGKDILYCY